MIIQIVKFESELSFEEVESVAKNRAEDFRKLNGLQQKYYVKLNQPNHYGGIYIWDSKESLMSFRGSELAASIPAAYQVKGQPVIEIFESLFALRKG